MLFLRLPPLSQTETPNKSRLENFKIPDRQINKSILINVIVLNKVWWKRTISITKLKSNSWPLSHGRMWYHQISLIKKIRFYQSWEDLNECAYQPHERAEAPKKKKEKFVERTTTKIRGRSQKPRLKLAVEEDVRPYPVHSGLVEIFFHSEIYSYFLL